MSILYLYQNSVKNYEKIQEQIKTCVCMIAKDENNKGIGFICKILPSKRKNDFNFLLISNRLLSSTDIKKDISIKIYMNNINENYLDLNLNESRKIFESKKYGITFIEIKNTDKINTFLELEENLYNEESYYNNQSIYILKYGENNNIFVSEGINRDFKENIHYINYFKNFNNSIMPILSLDSSKLIGLIDSQTNNPIFINYALSEFLLFYLEQIKINKVTAIYKNGNDSAKIKIFHEDFVKINRDKCKIIVEKEYIKDLCSELILDKKLKTKKKYHNRII